MNDSEKAKSIFMSAIEKYSQDQWPAFLDSACGGDVELRGRVEQLLRAHIDMGSIHASGQALTLDQPITEKPGTQIGPYKLLQKLGEGGMGVVYMAEQKQPMKRRVALKIIKPGMDTRQVIARFEAERQALAMMDHPNIAKVLDAGQTESGRPYFVMELVNGISVTKYCDQQHLTPKERLQLFVNICQAVQHAHQKGIIHRDLKPSNVLVALYDGKAVPKVIDFGVAKATNQSLTEKTMFTQIGQIVGTLEYMSPEQAQRSQLDVDTRSDIYSLGVILYELLSGETPFDSKKLRSAAFEEMLRIIREDEPSKPSTKVSSSDALPSIAANRRIAPQKLGATIRGELDWIVMKAMEKDRGRRYETASKFAEDVEHYLNDEAVVACPPSARYRFNKFARRNMVAIGTSAAIVVSLIAGIIGTSWQAYEARKERDRAVIAEGNAVKAEELAETRLATVSRQKNEIAEEKKHTEEQAAIAKAVNDFLQKDLLGMADAARQVENEITPDPNIKLRTLLDRAATTIEERFHDRPLVEAAIRTTLGKANFAIGRDQEAEEQYRLTLELRKQELGLEHHSTLASMNNLANSLYCQGQFQAAENLIRETLEISQRILGPEHPLTLYSMNILANSLLSQHKYQDSERFYRETLEISQRILGPEHSLTLNIMNNLGVLLNDQHQSGLRNDQQVEAAENLHREILEIRRRILGPEHPSTLQSMQNLAISLLGQGQYAAAEILHRETLEISQRVLGPEHPSTLQSMHDLAITVGHMEKFEEAEKLHRQTLEIRQRLLGPEHRDTLNSKIHIGAVVSEQGDLQLAEKLQREALDGVRRVLQTEDPLTRVILHNLAKNLYGQGKHEEAEKLHRECLEIRKRVLGAEHPNTLLSMHNLAISLLGQGQYAAAEILHRESLALYQRVLGPEHPSTLNSMHCLANTFGHMEKWEEAEKLFRETLEVSQRVLGPEHSFTLKRMINLAISLDELGQVKEAEKLNRETLEISQRILGPEHPYTLRSMFGVATSLAKQRKYQEAERLYRETLEIRQRVLGRENPATLKCMNNLVFCLNELRKYHEAEKLNRESLEIRLRVLGPEDPDTLKCMNNLVFCLNELRKYHEAEKLNRESLEIRLRVLGPEDPDTLSSMINLAISLDKLGQVKEAEKLNRETLEISQRILGPEHIQTLLSMNNLANSLYGQQKYREAEELFCEALESRRRVLGLTHPDTLYSTNRLVNSLVKQSKYQEAEKFLRDTFELYRKTVGADHSSTLGCLSNLVFVLNYQEKFAETESLLHQSFKSLERTAGADDPRTSMIRSKLVTFLTNRAWHLATASDPNKRDPEEAVRTATLATELSPDSANNWNNVGVAQYRFGDFDAALEAFQKADGMIEGGDREHRMFLAMTLWQLDRQEDALAKYVEGAAWIATNKESNGEQIRFRSEAETMMKIDSERREELIAKDDSDPSQHSAKPQMTQNIPTKEDTDK